MSISSIYILDLFGKPLISRNYRGTHDLEVIDRFMVSMLEGEEDKTPSPVFKVDEISFAFIKNNNVYIVATTHNNANISLVFVFLYKLIQVMGDYFKEVNEESVRDNFVVMHELFDEILDFGYPQTTDSKILMEYITQKGQELDVQQTIPLAVTNAVSWRSQGIKYKKNELFIDVTESIDLMVNSNGVVVRSEISGSISMIARLSGMPELQLGINNRFAYEKSGCEVEKYVDLDEVRMHQCVRLTKFANDHNICFIPPDGVFELMSYRISPSMKPPIWVDCLIDYYPKRKIELVVKVVSYFKSQQIASNCDIFIPVPGDVDSPQLKTAYGVASYAPERNVVHWSIKSLPGLKECYMAARFGLPSVESEEKHKPMPPVQVRFVIPFLAMSGLKVAYVKTVEKSGYKALTWMKYTTQNGDYQIRAREVVHSA